jgi:hypothetical protein
VFFSHSGQISQILFRLKKNIKMAFVCLKPSLWIRIRIDCGWLDSDLNQGGQKLPKKEKAKKCIVLNCWMFPFVEASTVAETSCIEA